MEKVLESMTEVFEAGGIKIDGLGDRSGRRFELQEVDTRGGSRVKNEQPHEPPWLHPDAVVAAKVKIEDSKRKFEKVSPSLSSSVLSSA